MARAHLSLRQVLTVPYVVLTLLVAAIIGGFSYVAGSQAVSVVSEELLRDMVSRVSQAVDRHLVGSRVALDAVFPDEMKAPVSMEAESESLRNRMWVATSLNPDPNNYVYYGNRRGQFAGVLRNADGSGEWRSGNSATTPRGLQRFAGLNAPLEKAFVESRLYDPRQRPWYIAALEAKKPAWSPAYVDNRTGELVATRVKPLFDANGRVLNRETFEKQVTRRIEEYRSGLRKAHFAVLFVDLDHFKRVNDQLGHQTGDVVLAELADRLKHALRSGDIVGRYGGDEFVVLLSEIESGAAASAVRDKIEQQMKEPLTSITAEVAAQLHVTASSGMAGYPEAGPDVSTLLAAADKEMYERKQAMREEI